MRIGGKLRTFREAAGWSVETAARHLGIEEKALYKFETGEIVPGREMQRRLLLTYFGKWTWVQTPSCPVPLNGGHRTPDVIEKFRMSADSQKRLRRLAKKFECSAGSTIELALEMLEDNVPVITALKEAARRYEDLRWKSILENNTDLQLILDGDPLMVRIAHEGLQYTHAKDKLLDPKFLTAWLSDREGTYIEAARLKWRRTEGNENDDGS